MNDASAVHTFAPNQWKTSVSWEVELTDLALLRIPHRIVCLLDGTDTAVTDGVRLRRLDHRRITVDGNGGQPAWL